VFKDNFKSIWFAAVVCIVCAVLLSGAASGLRSMQQENIELDVKKNILKALNVTVPAKSTNEAIQQLYADNVNELVVNTAGELQGNKTPADAIDNADLLPVYQKTQNNQVVATAIPIQGKGLWSTIKGYLALESDYNTVLGVTFYEQGETPGLGAEVAQDWFQDMWAGKKILSTDGTLESITVAKGTVAPDDKNKQHKVDGISGATMTGNGINVFVRNDLQKYQNYFNKVRE
jgi:Na+-transporting NADH:ubiquinone oxidoreductase subunit C